MNQLFSARQRTEYLQALAASPLDLLVIGGGITGCGIAWDAASRGLKVGLVEKGDFAGGTSSRSTKLIHGGLRYLKQGEIQLVREVGRERALLHRAAPHLVVPEPMLLPIYRGGTYGYYACSIGVFIYDWLAGVTGRERRQMFRRAATQRLEPLLKADGLLGGCRYYEYRTDDARLTVEVLKSAHRHGALAANYAEVVEFIHRDGKVAGARVQDHLGGRSWEISAAKLINAAGPWVDAVDRLDAPSAPGRLIWTKGVHCVVDARRLPVRQAVYFDVPDGRMIFVIPREGKTYIGTTDTNYQGSLDELAMNREEMEYLLHAVNAAFLAVRLTPDDVESSWAGVRPLIRQPGKGPSQISRRDELFVSPGGLITIAGGKLTGFRVMAQKAVDVAVRQLEQETGQTFGECRTAAQTISGGEAEAGRTYRESRLLWQEAGRALGLSTETVDYLLSRYGSAVRKIYEYFQETPEEETTEERRLRAEIRYCIDHEMTVGAEDFLTRRTGLLFFDRRRAECSLPAIVRIMGEYLDWDDAEKARQTQRAQRQIALAGGEF